MQNILMQDDFLTKRKLHFNLEIKDIIQALLLFYTYIRQENYTSNDF